MECYTIKEVVVKARNEKGVLHEIAHALGSKGINIEAISAYATDGKAIFRIVTADAFSAEKTLKPLSSTLSVSVEDIIVVKLPNRPGELGKVTEKLAKKGIDLESVYILNKFSRWTEVALKPDNTTKALEALECSLSQR